MSKQSEIKALRHMARIEKLQPQNRAQLRRFVQVMLGMRVPDRAIVPGHQAPMDYLERAFFESTHVSHALRDDRAGDLIVWACRGGGKTMLGAAATLLDLLFKPGIQIRILGGSFEQSTRMYRYLRQMMERPTLAATLATEPTQRKIQLVNGSVVEVLSQSQRSVRGQRVHKLRCDEVEEFRPEVWQAAQLITRSGRCGESVVRGSIEALSTMHRPFGLMHDLIENTNKTSDLSQDGNSKRGAMVIKWCAMDVIAKCPAERECATCVLWNDCQGKAKTADGFLPVVDLIAQWHRCSRVTWESEMMCQRPRVSDSVYPQFLESKHVIPFANRITSRKISEQDQHMLVAGCDFGIRSPLVWLWAIVEKQGEIPSVKIVGEHHGSDQTFEKHIEVIEKSAWSRPAWIGVDPAGNQRNEQTGLSNVQILRRRGYKVKSKRMATELGIEAVRRRLDHGTLQIDASCAALIRAMKEYHFDPQRADRDEPVKDGPDHFCDALRYMIVNLDGGSSGSCEQVHW